MRILCLFGGNRVILLVKRKCYIQDIVLGLTQNCSGKSYRRRRFTNTKARMVEQGFRAAWCEPATQSAHASAGASCKVNTVKAVLRKSYAC